MKIVNNSENNNLESAKQLFGGTLFWFVLALLVAGVVSFLSFRFDHITGEQVGVLLDRMSGKMEVITKPGVQIYFGITTKLYIFDKNLQTLEMSSVINRGEREGRDDLKVKTIDGSDVYVDLKVQYKIDENMADVVLKTSGPGDLYKLKWARDYVRSIARNCLGELTTEDFYDPSKRDAKRIKAELECKKRLAPFGIIIDSIVIPARPRFYAEYEAAIKKKKLADQAVNEERSKQLAAKQKQQTLIVQETNAKKVAIEKYLGVVKEKLIKAKAEGNKAERAADAYYDKITIGANAEYYQKQKMAEGILAEKRADAEGIEALKEALEGEGGRNMVKLEYAKKLKNVKINGQPFTIDGHVDKFEHNKAPAASVSR